MAEARKLAACARAKAPVAIRYIIDAVNKGLEMPFAEAQVFEATLFGLVVDDRGHARRHARRFSRSARPEFKGK